MQETLSSSRAINKDTDQPSHLCRLISAFFNHFFGKYHIKLATSVISGASPIYLMDIAIRQLDNKPVSISYYVTESHQIEDLT